MSRGRFITLEGIDGAGKTTAVATTLEWLKRRGHDIVHTREPGGTPLGERLRELVLSQSMTIETEVLVMFAARCEHVQTVIQPALERGAWVLSDRFSDASYAYQGGGRGLPVERIAALETWVLGDFRPDLTLYFDVPPEVAAERMSRGRYDRDRFEQEALAFHTRVRDAYRMIAEQNPERVRTIDATRSPAEVVDQVENILSTVCYQWK